MNYLKIMILKNLNKDESDSIEGPITYHEAALILKAMSNNQAQDQMVLARNFLKYFGRRSVIFKYVLLTMGFLKVNYLSLREKE